MAECERPNCVSVMGLGSRHYPGMDFGSPADGGDFHDAIARFRSEVAGRLAVPVHGSMFGRVCGDWELVLEILDWHQVDDAVARIGTFLAQGFSDAVAVCVTAEGTWRDIHSAGPDK